jgi:voltage-dependent calcium channel L type alpha-1S
MLLNIWYREDPQIDWENPPPPAPRTKFIEPYQWPGFVGQLIASDAFEGVISVAIIANIVCMSLDYNDAPRSYRNMLAAFSFIFFVIFLIEMGLKFKGMGGLKWYFAVGFNTFDFVLVMSAFPDAIAYLAGTQPFINLSMLRVFRLFRMFKLIRSMRQLLEVVASAGKAIGNLIIFIFFFVLIFAIFGMQMFSGKCREEDGSIPRTNFDGTGDALLALFQTMTGEDWTGIMWNVMRDNPVIGLIFFLIFYIMANYILMEMFCAVILENFQLTTEEKNQLQIDLYAVVQKKKAAAKALADSVDKELATKLKAEMEKKEKEDQQKRERAIREKNEGGAAPPEAPETPEQKKAREEAKAKADAALKAKIMEEAKAAQKDDIEVPDAGLDYAPADDGMDLGELDDGPKVKEKKNALPPSAIVEKTCFIFDQEHSFRAFMYQVEQTSAFEYTVFFAIIMGCVFLAADTPYKPNPDVTTMVEIGGPIILAIYNIELLVKVVSKGFIGKPSAYIMDPWNRVDFAVLVMSDIALFFKLIGLDGVLPASLIMAFRTLRVVRPLRLINQNERIQIVFNALFMSLPAILNVMTLLMFCLFMFSILGMGLYMGLFYSCNQDVTNRDECLGFAALDNDFVQPVVWDNPRYSFDNVWVGILVLFESSTLEGWVDVMHSCQDINGTPGGTTAKFEPTIPPLQPEKNKAVMQCLFIIAYICFGVFFVLNLVMGVMIEKFNQISGRGILTDDQKMYKDTILQAQLHDERQALARPGGAIRGWCYTVSQHPNFENTVLFLIVANAGIMASEHFKQSNSWTTFIGMINLTLTIIFTIEIIIRLIAIFPKQFFADPWNVMDFLIVVASLIMIPLDGIVNLQALRPFRLLLLFRMIKRAKGIRLMICTLLLSLPALFNVTCMLFLCYFIYAILGMSWWSNIKFNEAIGLPAHYRTFVDSLLMLGRTTTGEGWNSMLHDCMLTKPDCTDYFGSSTDGWATDLTEMSADTTLNGNHYWLANDCGNAAYSVIFYVTFNIVGTFCMINLFVAVILDNYAFMANVGDAEINEFVLDKFKKCWYRYTLADKHASKHLGKYLRVARLRNFLNDLGAPLGIVVWDSEGTKKYKEIREQVRQLQTPGMGVEYRQMQQILCDVTMGPHMMPYEEKVKREEFLNELALKRAAIVIQAMYKGKKSRAALGVKKGAAVSEADAKAKDFKKRFMTMLANPSAAKPIAPPPAAGGASLEPGVAPTSPAAAAAAAAAAPAAPAAGASMEAEVDGVRNIFKERAAQRAAARASKG